MQATYNVQVQADRYPTNYDVQASSWIGAFSKGVNLWKKSAGKGSRSTVLTVKLMRTVARPQAGGQNV